MLPAMFSAFNVYFIKRKNSMMGISQTIVAGISMGIPYICSLLMDKYGFQGTVVIISAISLHGVLAMITLQPVEWHMRKVRISSVDQSSTLSTVSDKKKMKNAGFVITCALLIYSRNEIKFGIIHI